MGFNTGLKPGDVVDKDQLQSIFHFSDQGSMCRSLKTNTLI
jgi:hypothetical protein